MATYADLGRYEIDLRNRSVKDPSRLSYLKRLRETYGKPLLDLSAEEINAWIASLGVAPSTHRLVTNYVKNALKFLNGGEPPAVSRRITRPKGKPLSRIRSARELLTPSQVEDLIHASRRLDLKALIALHVATGARPSELLNLDRADVEFVTVKGVPAVRVRIRKTKTDSPRSIITFDARTLRWLKEWMGTGDGTGPLWTFHRPRVYWRYLKELAFKAGIEKNVYPYLFRHMRATELYDAPPNVRDAQMGWTPGSNQFANYTFLRPEQVEDAIWKREAGPTETPAEQLRRKFLEMLDLMETLPGIEEYNAANPGAAEEIERARGVFKEMKFD